VAVIKGEEFSRQIKYKYNFSHVEAGSNISTVALRVVGDDEKGSLESERVKYGHDY
jgi:hypothetical protein